MKREAIFLVSPKSFSSYSITYIRILLTLIWYLTSIFLKTNPTNRGHYMPIDRDTILNSFWKSQSINEDPDHNHSRILLIGWSYILKNTGGKIIWKILVRGTTKITRIYFAPAPNFFLTSSTRVSWKELIFL